MTIFSQVNQTFDRYPMTKTIYSIELSFKQFYQALKYHCQEWIHSYGQYLYLSMSNKLKEVNDTLDNLFQQLQHDTDTVPDLKFVLNIISQINLQQESIGHTIHDIEQSYRILQQHHFEYPQSDWILIQTLSSRLTDLINQSHLVEHRLKSIRERFRMIIQYDIDLFQRIVDELVDKFDRYGPYTIENDLSRTFSLVKEYENELNKIEQRKIELINMMKLFHIPLINYPHLMRIEKEISGLTILSNLYDEFNQNKILWSNILWTELDINNLIINVDGFIKNFRHLSSDIKSTVTGRTVEKYLTGMMRSIIKKKNVHF
jgi:dynein heavy chain